MSEMMRKLILDFLQERALELRQVYRDGSHAEVIEAKLLEDPLRVGVVLDGLPTGNPGCFEFRGVKIISEIIGYESRDHSQAVTIQAPVDDTQQIGTAQQTQPVQDSVFHASFTPGCLPASEGKEGEPVAAPDTPTAVQAQPDETVHHPFSPEQAKALGIIEAPNPYSVDPRTGKTAFQIWKERHEKGSKK